MRKPFLSIAINKKAKFDGVRCPFSTFLRLQGDHQCACAQKWCHFSYFVKSFQTKKIKALRPKMTKIASRGVVVHSFRFLTGNPHSKSKTLFNCGKPTKKKLFLKAYKSQIE